MKYVKSFEPKIKEKCLQKLSMKKEEIITQSKIEEQKLNSLKFIFNKLFSIFIPIFEIFGCLISFFLKASVAKISKFFI